jgi:YHS domain-containing protein
VGAGGTSLLLGTWAKRHRRKVFSFDTFTGIPHSADPRENPYFLKGDFRPIRGGDLEQAFRSQIEKFGLEETIVPVAGVFPKSLKKSGCSKKLAFVHIDGDTYKSTFDSLKELFPRVAVGGVIAVDDFFHSSQGVARATSDYFNSVGSAQVYQVVFPSSVFFVKGRGLSAHEAALSSSYDGNTYSFRSMRQDKEFKRVLRLVLNSKIGKIGRCEVEELLNLLGQPEDGRNDILVYLKSLKSYWDAQTGPFVRRGLIEI